MIKIENIGRDLAAIRAKSPLIHNITNFVVMNNTANALLSIGASPVMAHSIDEVADMVSIASALVLNIGTLDLQQVGAMVVAGQAAIQRGIPIILDPVGAGATPYRTSVCRELIEECCPSIIRGNSSEIQALYNSSIVTKGVDSTHTSESALAAAQAVARLSGAVVVVSGQTDYITDGTQTESVENGSPIMQRVTGMGCTATALVAAFAAINPNYLEASTHAMTVMGICGERAAAHSKGTGSLQVNFLDELYNLEITVIENCLKNPQQ